MFRQAAEMDPVLAEILCPSLGVFAAAQQLHHIPGSEVYFVATSEENVIISILSRDHFHNDDLNLSLSLKCPRRLLTENSGFRHSPQLTAPL